jgi:chaperonin GroEL
MSKIIELGADAREKLVEGIDTLADAVISTLGPNGRNVVISKSHEPIKSTKDGVRYQPIMTLKLVNLLHLLLIK